MKSSVLVALVGAIFFAAFAIPAHAQATRTWVSGVGDDANPCSRTAPCKTFAGAIAKTASPGEINCLDPAGFGALTITKSINIICDGVSNGGVLVAGTNGITVVGPANSRVVLSGLDFEGLGPSGSAGLNGVSITGQGTTVIRNCTIRDFGGNGVNVAATTGVARVLIQNSIIFNNGNAGTTAGGVNITGTSGATNDAEVLNSLIDTNTNFNIQVVGPSATLVLSASTLTGTSPTSIITSGGGQLISYGNNVLRNGGSPTSTMPLQ
jgi:hypothetical protein